MEVEVWKALSTGESFGGDAAPFLPFALDCGGRRAWPGLA